MSLISQVKPIPSPKTAAPNPSVPLEHRGPDPSASFVQNSQTSGRFVQIVQNSRRGSDDTPRPPGQPEADADAGPAGSGADYDRADQREERFPEEVGKLRPLRAEAERRERDGDPEDCRD